jgi:cysteinyl-tRNA synthetase
MDTHGELRAALDKRVSIRLRDGDGFRDLLGVLKSENLLIRRNGEVAEFNPADIAFFRVVPVFTPGNLENPIFHIYDTASRTSVPITGDLVRIYSCGPTVYRDAHIGNMRTFLLTDLIRRTLAINGIETLSVSNITDVGHMAEDLVTEIEGGDKVLEEAKSQSLSALEIARKYESRFHDDLAHLNILPVDFYPRASEKIEEIITSISRLLELNAAYVGEDGNIYFDARSAAGYGYISGNKLDQLQPGHRYEYSGDGGKRFHADWALWKLAGNRSEMVWDSPWGAGFPGWHIECSAMSLQLLGDSIDIHVGGIDLRFPHHENERAQTNALAQSEVVSHWVHGEHLLFEGRKMSKSAGNVLLVSSLIEAGLDPLSLRLALLENRYRSQIDMTWQNLKAADATLARWRSAIDTWGTSQEVKVDSEIRNYFMNDLDTPKAILRLRAIEKDPALGSQDKRAIFLFADQVLGLDLDRPPAQEVISDEVQQLIDARSAARAAGNWSESDRLRDQLLALGITPNDKKA